MKETTINKEIVDRLVAQLGIQDFAKATIREVKQVAAMAEKESGVEYIKMEMGIPGLPAAQVGVDAQIQALKDGIAHSYPDIQGYPGLKKEASRFVKAFIGIDLDAEGCVPVTGSMQGTFASFLVCSQCNPQKDTVLFIDPGFPVQKMQLKVMGVKFETFDVYDYRGVNPFEELARLPVPVVFCLGNHEFAERSIGNTFAYYHLCSHFDNVKCLDIEGRVDIGDVRFVGNVLWYDGSLSDRWDVQSKLQKIDDTWLDCTIVDFDAKKANENCIKQIKDGLAGYSGKSVLVTHCVPYWKLNRWSFTSPDGVYNIYSGVKDLFHNNDVNVDVAVCGHTHRKEKLEYTKDGKHIRCYNIGNDYFRYSDIIEYEMIEL